MFAFFGSFGFTEETRKNYHLLDFSLDKPLGCTTFTKGMATADPGVDMSIQHAIHQTKSKRDPDLFLDKPSILTAINQHNLNFLQPHSSMEQLTLSSSLNPHSDMVRRASEPPLVTTRTVPDTTHWGLTPAYPAGKLRVF